MSRNQRVGLTLVAVIVVAAGFVIAGSQGSRVTTTGKAHVYIVHGQPVGGIAALDYRSGQTVDLTVTSDLSDEIHIHGYDLHQSVLQGHSVHFAFRASLEGEFVIELESRKEQIASLRVSP